MQCRFLLPGLLVFYVGLRMAQCILVNIYALPFVNLNFMHVLCIFFLFRLPIRSLTLLILFPFLFSISLYIHVVAHEVTDLLVLHATEYCLVTTNPSLYANSRKCNLLYRSMVYASQHSNGTCMQIPKNVVFTPLISADYLSTN